MKEYETTSINGKKIVFLVPETPEDHEFLKQNELDGKVSANASFGDWKEKEKRKDEPKV
jgi:hypothetical protein